MPCKEGYEKNIKGRCVKICKSGTKRNPNSGRCKRVSTRRRRIPPIRPIQRRPNLRLCKDGFERSQFSGNCVKICKPGTERNPNSGRCKKVSSNPITSNPVTSNPITFNPVTFNPVTSNPVTSNPVTSNPVPDNDFEVTNDDCEVTNDEIDGFFSKDVENCIQELFCTQEEGKKFHEIFSDRRLPGESNCQALTRLIFPDFITKITKLLGKGAQGSVFEALDSNGKQVAIKITIATDDEFERELRISKKMESLDVGVPILGHSIEVIKDSGKLNHKFIMMDKIDGTIIDLLNSRPFSNTELKSITDEIIRIIKLLSDNNLVHGDMHVSNIGYKIQEDGSTKLILIDFGFSLEVSMPRADLVQAIRVTWFMANNDIKFRYDKFIREKAEEVLKIRTVKTLEIGYDTIYSYSFLSGRVVLRNGKRVFVRMSEDELDEIITSEYDLDMTAAIEGRSRKYPFPPFPIA